MSKAITTIQLNPKQVFEALGVSMADVNEDQQARIATFLAKSARSLKHALKEHEKGISIESQLVSALSLTSEQASMSSAPFHQILQDEGKDSNFMESNISKGKKKKKDNTIESDESSSESDSSSSSDDKSSSSSDSDDYISMAEQQVPIEGRIRKYQGKFIQIPFDLTGATGVTQVGNVVTISSSSLRSIFLNKVFNEGIWRIYFQLIKNNNMVIGVAEPSFNISQCMGRDKLSMNIQSSGYIEYNNQTTSGNKSSSANDIIGMEVNMISHRIFFFHTFEQQPVCLINIPANLKVGVTYGPTNDAQLKVVAVYKLKKPLADPTKSPTIKTWES
ncbi:MAG: hypothetical protein EZS28_011088 [Streblomastix strix]|uniref:SPRY domain-containing protein n=1 Tax=Streblomastix strix TaxID=222440 RepID=A0A5J4WF64_9EUKA|nr:MAG: hypothetical protein EZS28_011088 [Streblomastix strix]